MSTMPDDNVPTSTKEDFQKDYISIANGRNDSNDSNDDEITKRPDRTPLQRSIEVETNEASENIPSMLNNNMTDDTTKQERQIKPCSRKNNISHHRSNNNRNGTDCTDAHSNVGGNEPNDGTDDDTDYDRYRRSSSATTIEATNQRGRSRKLVIESLYLEISELRKQNEVLRRIWDDVQFQPRGGDTKMTTFQQQHQSQQQQQGVPCTVQVSDGSDDTLGNSDLDEGVGEGAEEFKTERRTSKYDNTAEDDAEIRQLDFERLFYS
mmetsp:Transcript_11619/g.20938  ORF Transcript_11619/g.20938 Transcript_11619/m.20938 type:complete len:265 (-) Transcript_11619:107-901(-)